MDAVDVAVSIHARVSGRPGPRDINSNAKSFRSTPA